MPRPSWSPRLLRAHVLAAHLSLLAALLWTAARPHALTGSILHPEVLACVHLVTLGCVTTTCLGAFHVVLPLAMRAAVPAGFRDWFLLATVLAVALGVAAHMALGTYGGVHWSAALLLVALALQLPRFVLPVLTAKAPLAMRLGNLLAWTNLVLAVVLGAALAWNRTHPIGIAPLSGLFAHAHLALLGFAGTLVASVGMRLLPMLLPASPPPAPLALAAVLGLGGGAFVTAAGAFESALLAPGLAVQLAGGLAWLGTVAAMLRAPRPAPADVLLARPARWLLGTSFVAFAAAASLGALLELGLCPPEWWAVYGSVLLLGGFVSLILGTGQRLVPLAARVHGGGTASAHAPARPRLATAAAIGWSTGVAALAAAQVTASPAGVRAAALLLAAAALADLLSSAPR